MIIDAIRYSFVLYIYKYIIIDQTKKNKLLFDLIKGKKTIMIMKFSIK
jgi:hypothetical protein